jgi:hypothetical protein
MDAVPIVPPLFWGTKNTTLHELQTGDRSRATDSLGSLLLPALSHPDQTNPLFLDHVLLAVGVHVAQTYGGMRPWARSTGVGSRHGRSDARRKFFAPTSKSVWRSGRWRESAACQWVISRTPFVARWEWRRTNG